MNKIRKGDEVIVLAGKDKGKRGRVVLRKDDEHLVVEGINLVKKHTKPNPLKGTTGGIVEKAMPIHQSNVAIFNPRPARPTAWASRSTATSAARLQVVRRRNQGGLTMSRLQEHYREKVVPQLTEKFGYKSPMQVPRITKITLNMGVSEAVADKKVMEHAVGDLTKIAGQKPVVTKAKKAIAGFKIREGQAIGTMVTLRGARMYEFLDRFVTVALPRVRDFRGVSAGPSTAAATTTSASRNRSSSRRSSTTRSTPCAA
jgi:ribosomal protein L24